MKRLAVDAERLIMALECHAGERRWYLDRGSGEVVNGDDLTEPEAEKYLLIEPLPASVSVQVMCDFLETLHDGDARRQLAEAVQRNRPDRRFPAVLEQYPELRAQWEQHHQRVFRRLAREWLRDQEMHADLVETGDAVRHAG